MTLSDSPKNKAQIASELRTLLEDMVKTGSLNLHMENLTGEDIRFNYSRNSTGGYTIDLYSNESYFDLDDDTRERIESIFKLTKIKLNISVKV